eukprot:Protomagalhaensia_sp_Gyna_25__5985@NODE_930_length_2398_cov_24_690547_g736_i0_p1_GENE_NODE_930_length_2398_cov_24_690547_g736_i0NODE_930_length_2398_cov_24_690547_g736_i0_p1_ORF_typecomplete_len618_score100_77MGDG_synth/PF06925_11/2e44Glyco_tran_28_C/PF04101_16/0_39Glyco_tran_28_C/PF04101_16/6_2e14Glyco_trans_1_3/PF13528_6/2_1e02Glyco_trans_1_3/PF13528_6/0_0053Glyco_trans_1_4/PF13692_6/0_026Glycos_transf_1/PF00534_20/0_1_NODE_930_length_2398_cov_24_690547_g736_i02882141
MTRNSKVLPSPTRRKRILILLSDTGGGHRASAGAIQDALNHLYGTDAIEIIILDIWTDYGRWPFNSFVSVYRFASENPWCWKMMYESTRSPISRSLFLSSGYAVSGGNFASVFEQLRPDLVISVHPLCQHVPLQIMEELKDKISAPFVTIVTDLGGCHPTWFHPKASRIYVPSQAVMDLALAEGINEHQLRLFGLPLRRAFWSFPANEKDFYRDKLGFTRGTRTCLVVGGGEGVGGIDAVAAGIATTFFEDDKLIADKVKALGSDKLDAKVHLNHKEGIRHMQVVIICGKNEQTRQKVLTRLREIQQLQGPNAIIVDDRSTRYEGPGAVKITTTRGRALSDPDISQSVLPQKTPAQRAWGRISRLIFGVDSNVSGGASANSSLSEEKLDVDSMVETHNSSVHFSPSRSRPRAMSEDCVAIQKALVQLDLDGVSSPRHESMNPCKDNELPTLRRYQSVRTPGVSTAPAPTPTPMTHTHQETSAPDAKPSPPIQLRVIIFGFSNNIDEVMAASDLIVTKAGPGTIAEAMTRGLPIMLSSYMPGQEEGNVSYVLDGNFGAYCVDPKMIGVIVREWLTNPRFEGETTIKGGHIKNHGGRGSYILAFQIYHACNQPLCFQVN